MEALDVPELFAIPDPAPYDMNPSEVVDFLMTALFQRLPATLHAEFRNGQGNWFVQSIHKENCVVEFKSVGYFRAVLARFGAHYMDRQLYGGHIRRVLTQGGRKISCCIFMSNDNWTGYWIRIYARAA